MKTTNGIRLVVVFTFMGSIVLARCSIFNRKPVEAISPLMTQELAMMTRIGTPDFRKVTPSLPKNIPSSVFTPTATNSPETIKTPTPTGTMTAMPTLSPEEAKNFVKTLYETNRDCLLPCWWGFTPGITTWQEARSFLVRFAELDNLVQETKSHFYIWMLVPVPEEWFPYPLQHLYQVNEGVITTMEIEKVFGPSYTLSSLLSTYGPPGEIWISTYSTEYPPGVLPFQIVFLYPEKGILATYFPNRTYFSSSKVRACQVDTLASKLGLWIPGQRIEFFDAARLFRLQPDEPGILYLPLEEATGMDVKTFYEIYKVSGSSKCLETPKDLWPEQF